MSGNINGHQSADFLYRNVLPDDADRIIEIERTCFPPEQAIPESSLRGLMRVAGDCHLVAVHRLTGDIAATLFGLATDESRFRDEFFTDPSLHKSDGKNMMLLSLEVDSSYRGAGIARTLMEMYLETERLRNRQEIFLTCVEGKIGMYERMGFMRRGLSASTLGGETWYDMSIVLNGASRY